MDQSKTQISLTLWGENAQKFDHSQYVGEIIAVKGAALGTFNGRSLSASFSSIISYQIDQTGDEYAVKVQFLMVLCVEIKRFLSVDELV